jgi:HD-like signal output (HDOD) protein
VRELHEEVAGVLASAWRLPADVQFVMANHHHPIHDGRTHPLIAAIELAEGLAAELGVPGIADTPANSVSAAVRLTLPSTSLDPIRKRAQKILSLLE